MSAKFRNISFVAWCGFLSCVLGFVFFVRWLGTQGSFEFFGYIPALVSLLIIFYAVYCAVPVLEDFWRIKRSHIDLKDPFFVYLGIIGWCLFVNGIFIGLAYIKTKDASPVEAISRFITVNNDTPRYIEIAEKWYVNNELDHRFSIVFLPLYPILIRLLYSVLGNFAFCGYLISNACAILSGVMFYKLSLLFADEKQSRSALKYLYLFPSAFFLFLPLTESLFLLLSVSCVYYTIERNYKLVFILGFLATLARLQGIVLTVPIVVEMIYSARKAQLNGKLDIKAAVINALCLTGFFLGAMVYLGINLIIYDNAFQFLVFQKEHWGQQMGFFWNTITYFVDYCKNWISQGELTKVSGISLPNMIAFWLTLGLIAYGAKKLRPSLTLYNMAYFIVSFGSSWVLSGPRYMVCLFPMAFVAAEIGAKKKGYRIALAGLYVVFLMLYFNEFVLFHQVY